jgi:hypothetical protein
LNLRMSAHICSICCSSCLSSACVPRSDPIDRGKKK